jgi:hypothetical protein
MLGLERESKDEKHLQHIIPHYKEIVAGRRAFLPSPMCAASILQTAANYRLGNVPVLVGLGKDDEAGVAEVQLVDFSNIWSGYSSSPIWNGERCVESDVWQ